MNFQSKFLNILNQRGFIHQQTDAAALDKLLTEGEKNKKPVVAYIGFDCTAKSLHVGSLLQIMALRWFQQCGHKPIVLLGGGTTKIGDPSGKDKSRELLDDAAIEANKAGIKRNFESFLEFEDKFAAGTTKAVLLDNAAWLESLNYVEFLGNFGRHFSVNRMLTMDSVKLRLERESHLSFLEFNYMVLQAYDFVVLNEQYGCRLQIGGSDQWGNIVMGTDLWHGVRTEKNSRLMKTVRKSLVDKQVDLSVPELESLARRLAVLRDKAKGLSDEELISIHEEMKKLVAESEAVLDSAFTAEAKEIVSEERDNFRIKQAIFGLTTPLITTASGAKMGKTMAGAVWLSGDLLSPYDYWQFWRNTEDADVGRFLKFFTELPLEEIERLEALPGAEINDAKKVLATEATRLLHGEKAAQEALRTAEDTFEHGRLGEDLPEVAISRAELEAGIPAFKLLHQAGLAASGKEARNLIKGGGARVNDEKITDEMQPINALDLTEHGVIKLSAGRKKHVLVRAA